MKLYCHCENYDDWKEYLLPDEDYDFAAEQHAEEVWDMSAGEIGDKFTILVKRRLEDPDSSAKRFDIEMDWSPNFYATERK